MTSLPTRNRLADAKSPYLQQHAANPMAWQPWDRATLALARQVDRPIFLSIGYATCHWCHVMARESFADPEVAALFNRVFINIKVDREERPDIDQLYMLACQLLTGGGGWPLSLVLMPDTRPIFAATYLAKESSLGRPGMLELGRRIEQLWTTRRPEIERSAASLGQSLQDLQQPPAPGAIDDSVYHRCYEELEQRYDVHHGGFGPAPKFPTPHTLSFLLRYGRRYDSGKAVDMACTTLTRMADGGIHDQLGGGFHRYATDAAWLVPHFEKMLYDQALLILAYLDAATVRNRRQFTTMAQSILDYTLGTLRHPDGGFFCGEDADSEGVEGKFYLWRQEEIRALLEEHDFSLIKRYFNLHQEGNYQDERSGTKTGLNILHRSPGVSIARLADTMHLSPAQITERLQAIGAILSRHRNQRVRPHLDDKILTDWNGLMLAALSRAATVLGAPRYLDIARRNADFLLSRLLRAGQLQHRFYHHSAGINGFVDDYAALCWGLTELVRAGGGDSYLRHAQTLAATLIDQFLDPDSQLLFTTAANTSTLLYRTRELYDGALPAGNSMALLALYRLLQLTGKQQYRHHAAALRRATGGAAAHQPAGHTFLLLAAMIGDTIDN